MARLPSPSDPPIPRMVVILVGLAASFLVVAGLRGLSDIVGPTFLALVLTIAAQPIRAAAERRGIPGWIGGMAALREFASRQGREEELLKQYEGNAAQNRLAIEQLRQESQQPR